MEELLSQLNQLAPNSHLSDTPFQQQLLFQEVLQQLSASLSQERPSPSKICAEQAASYLRSHFREHITAQQLGENLNFHPVYIARCMKKEYGCAPMDYLLHYRIQQSKLLLMQTSYTIARIAEEVGFNQAPYFSFSFVRIEGTTPRNSANVSRNPKHAKERKKGCSPPHGLRNIPCCSLLQTLLLYVSIPLLDIFGLDFLKTGLLSLFHKGG